MAQDGYVSFYSGCIRLEPPVTDEALAQLAGMAWRTAYEGLDSSIIQDIDLAQEGICLILSTDSAWRVPLAKSVAGLLAQRIGNVDGCVVDDIELALHEAICNAVFHGNLDLGEATRTTPATMDFYHHHAQQKLSDPRLAARRVIIRAHWTDDDITISVQDEGSGEGLQRLRAQNIDPVQSSQRLGGHGLRLMQSLTQGVSIDPSHRRVTLVFSRMRVVAEDETRGVPDQLVSVSEGMVTQEDLSQCRILVVDDVAANIQMIDHFLREAGWTQITHARDGAQGLALLNEGVYDLVLLDVAMPGMDGFEVCRRIRQNPRLKSIPVVMQTAFTGMRERQQAFTSGATDYVTKPLDYTELTARLRVHLAKRLLIQTLRKFHDRLARDLDMAREMQHESLPSPAQLKALSDLSPAIVHGVHRPCSELAGDIWGVDLLPGGLCCVFLADISGHGVGAAINAFRLQTLIRLEDPAVRRDPSLMLMSLNRHLSDMLRPGQFVSIFYAVVDFSDHMLHWSGAGMPDPILRQRADAPSISLDASGVPLGLRPHTTYSNNSKPFPPGACLLMYSDALLETAASDHVYPTEAMVADWLDKQDIYDQPQAILDSLLSQSLQGGAHPVAQDDLTLVCLKHGGAKTAS